MMNHPVRLFHYFSSSSLTNVYLIAANEGSDAVLVDPAVFDVPLLELIEGHGLTIRAVLVTHETEGHLRGLRTLLRVYDAAIYAANARVLEYTAVAVAASAEVEVAGLRIEPISLPGYWSDALIYRVGGFLFTGEVLSAGRVGESINPYARELLCADLHDRVLSLPPQTIVLPCTGPPSTVSAELKTNEDLTRGFGRNL